MATKNSQGLIVAIVDLPGGNPTDWYVNNCSRINAKFFSLLSRSTFGDAISSSKLYLGGDVIVPRIVVEVKFTPTFPGDPLARIDFQNQLKHDSSIIALRVLEEFYSYHLRTGD